MNNQRNLTVFSHRRLGKTDLILPCFYQVQKQIDQRCIYVDLMHTRSTANFIKAFARSVIGRFDKRTTRIIKTFARIVKSIRPNITIDPMTGEPAIDISLQGSAGKETTIDEIFTFLRNQEINFIIAFDGFQQIGNYPEKNLEALLRAHIQRMSNTTFIFSGSQRHMLLSMFSDSSRPFYQSTGFLNFGKINAREYATFITKQFEKNRRTIEPDAIEQVLELTDTYTFMYSFYATSSLVPTPEKSQWNWSTKQCCRFLKNRR